eukprot:5311221-Alexandrium_andersonii.AAC.1
MCRFTPCVSGSLGVLAQSHRAATIHLPRAVIQHGRVRISRGAQLKHVCTLCARAVVLGHPGMVQAWYRRCGRVARGVSTQ